MQVRRRPFDTVGRVVTAEDVRVVALELPRSTEGFVRGRRKFYIGRIVYLAFSRDETLMGFAFPKDFREALIASAAPTRIPSGPWCGTSS